MAKKAPGLPMMPFWVGDWLSSTRHMSLAERSLFFDLLCHQWLFGPLKQEPDRLARLAGVSDREFLAMWDVVGPMFPLQPDNTIANERLERERRKALNMRRKAHERAVSGGEANRERLAAKRDAESQALSLATSLATSLPSTSAKSSAQAQPEAELQPRLEHSSSSSASSASSTPPQPPTRRAEKGTYTQPQQERETIRKHLLKAQRECKPGDYDGMARMVGNIVSPDQARQIVEGR